MNPWSARSSSLSEAISLAGRLVVQMISYRLETHAARAEILMSAFQVSLPPCESSAQPFRIRSQRRRGISAVSRASQG